MSPIYGSDDVGFVLLSGKDIRSNVTDLTENAEAVIEETTVLGSSWTEMSPVGLNKFDIGLNGFWDDADNLSNETLNNVQGSTMVLSWAPSGNTVGKIARSGTIVEKNFSRLPSRGALTKFSGTLQGHGQLEDAVILKTLGASTGSTGNTHATSYDGGSSSTRGGAGYFQFSSVTFPAASTALVAYVRHSVDDTTWVDLITFTGVSSAAFQSGERVATAASTTPVQRYLAAAWATNSTVADSTFTFTGMVAFYRHH